MNIVIIGAARGLGRSLTAKFLAEGHRVAAGVRDCRALAALQLEYPDALHVFEADVTDEALIARGAAQCREWFGEVDSLCISAGVIMPGDRTALIHQSSIDDLRATLDINTVGPAIVAKQYYPIMRRGGTVMIVTSEGAGIGGNGSWIPFYSLSKTAATKLAGLFNAAVDDVDFYAVHPGRMNTDMGRTTAQIEPEVAADGIYDLMTGATPLSRAEWYIDYLGRPMTT